MSLFEKVRKKASLWFLNFAQFGAVINDNIYKLVMVFILIELYGVESANTILSATGAVYVIPFLLFSSASGVLADRYSKKWILSVIKLFEVCIFAIALFVVNEKTAIGFYLLLFALATHSACFGPSKYGIIPELVPTEKVPKANGLITSFTYLGIIIGTFLASFLSEFTNCRYVDVMWFCLAIAVFGLLNALCIPRTPRQGSKRKIQLFFIREIAQTLRSCRQEPHLLLVLFSSTFFLFIGAFTQLNIIPYALQGLHLSEIYGGYLFLCTALGIAAGAFLIGRFLKKPIALWIPCAGGLGLAIFFFALAFEPILPLTIAFLFCLGFVGGIFIVPLDSFVQLCCSDETRGQVIAAGNFLGFCGVLIASFLLYFIGTSLHLSAMAGFGILGVLTLFYALALFFRFSDSTLPLLVKRLLRTPMTIELSDPKILEATSMTPLVLYNGTLRQSILLASIVPHYRFLFIEEKSSLKKFILRLFYSFSAPYDPYLAVKDHQALCFVLPQGSSPSFLPHRFLRVEVVTPQNKQEPIHIRIL